MTIRAHLPAGTDSGLIMPCGGRATTVRQRNDDSWSDGARTLDDYRRERSLTLPHRAGLPLDKDGLAQTKVQTWLLGWLRARCPIASTRLRR
jgi:hypothetical protein